MPSLIHVLKNANIKRNFTVELGQEDVRLIQQKLLRILDDIMSVCDELGVDCLLSGGTALGAVRHKGFIPWDDDVDLFIKRSDLDRFVTRFNERFPSEYWVHVPGVTPGYDCMMARVISKEIRARVLLDSEKYECGLMIDLFIVENTFDNPIFRAVHGLGCMFFRYVLSCIRFCRVSRELDKLVEDTDGLKKFMSARVFWGKLFSVIPLSAWATMASRWVSMCGDESSKYVAITSGSKQFFKEMYVRKDFCTPRECIFEGRTLKLPSDYDTYLRILYGDYMAVPPVDKREKHMMMELDREKLYG